MPKHRFAPVDPVFRIPDMPVDAEYLVERALMLFSQFSTDRVRWIERREEFYLQWDDYLTPVHKGLWNSSSNVHLPLTEIQANAMHARIMQAVFFVTPPFFTDPQEDMDDFRIQKIEKMMKYILMRYANMGKGIYNAIDDFAWDLVSDGMGILSRDWSTLYRRHLSVVENTEWKQRSIDLDKKLLDDLDENDFSDIASELSSKPYLEKFVIRKVHDCPVVRAEDPSYILFKGDVVDSTDLNAHNTVIKVCYFNEDELLSFKDRQIMDEDVVDKILEMGPDRKGSTLGTMQHGRLNMARDMATGVQTINSNYVEDKYEFLCLYDTVTPTKVKRSTPADRLVYFIHPKSKELARWSFLDRITTTGKLPLHMAHLYRRPRKSIGRGLVETQMPLNDVQDILLNQSIDAGMLANNPMGLYKGNSTFDPDEFRVEPGLMLKTDDPNTDIRLLTWPVNPNWSVPIQSLIQSFSSQLVSLGPQNSGQVGGPIGPMRSTSGLNALQSQADINLDVLLKRVNWDCLSDLYDGLYQDSIERMPESLKITVMGMDGIVETDSEGKPIREAVSKAELRAKVHFGLYANSMNMNRTTQLQASMQMAQFLFQRATMETGIVRPPQIYEICKEILQTMGKTRIDRFIAKPEGAGAIPVEAEVFCALQGIKPTVVLADPDHEKKIEKLNEILSLDPEVLQQKYGYVNPQAMSIIERLIEDHGRLLATLQQATNMANPTGSNSSPTLGLHEGQSPAQAEAGSQALPQESGPEPVTPNQSQGQQAPQGE